MGLLLLALTQIPNFVWIWPWGPNTGFRSAGLSSGHYERRFPAILRDMPLIGMVLVTGHERLVIDYDLTLDEGTASFTIWKWPSVGHRPRYVGPRQITESDQDRIDVVPGGPGLYQIFMHGYQLQGAVAVDWRTEHDRRRADAGQDG
ncbi:MAG TPA: hypothetical protein VE631_07305 [Alphaproteobacteria bacterium]|nr:hypothetical protein [Alphaproteobacteria bacterium]